MYIQYAGFWKRVGAFLIDAAVFVPVWFIVAAFAGNDATSEATGATLPLFMILAPWLYCAVLESSAWQGTVGKKLCGIVVTDREGHRISFARATGRHFAKIISSIPLNFGFIMAGFTAKKQGLHDLITGCVLVQRQEQAKLSV